LNRLRLGFVLLFQGDESLVPAVLTDIPYG